MHDAQCGMPNAHDRVFRAVDLTLIERARRGSRSDDDGAKENEKHGGHSHGNGIFRAFALVSIRVPVTR